MTDKVLAHVIRHTYKHIL